MPTYEYQCEECGAVFDVLQSIKARPLRKTACPECETSRPVKRLISTGGAVIFKGSGFYETDYRSEGYKKAAKSDTETGGTSPSSGETKSTEPKSGDTKTGDTKSGESKSGDAKSSDTGGSSKSSDKSAAKKDTQSAKAKATA